ncbi:DEAD/DEAH box helicase [Kitasatospora sp. SUK 42]|uniref:DEAD/DEAH box helicase n=1 Tax=Kitasatospora sp. SUK 42 TaxID=1588882 RepID=UPI0018C910EB|nr:DEAD/DEAH box helicase [Kitasatospora sp. SUK 42]MBV2152019.1 DEAD/DEAH box helicase [Kitasatospora sp. SUK 42]
MTDTQTEPSLRIVFDVSRTRVVLRTTPGHEQDFADLAARIAPGGQRGPLVGEFELDDFLDRIIELGSWRHDGVEWEDALVQLVTGVLDDAERAEQTLRSGADVGQGAVAPDDVPGLLGDGWTGDLTPFQLRDAAQLLSLGHGANFSVPGAGKTRVSLAVYAAMREQGLAKRLLVVGPKSAYEAWQTESQLCFRTPPRIAVMGRTPDYGAEVLLVNYERLSRAVPGLASWLGAAPSMLVLDEAHRMKLGANGTYGSACLALGPTATRRLILTGTPAPNGARDLENLLSFVWPGRGKRVVSDAVRGGDLAYASTVLRPLFTRTTKRELGLPPFEPKVRYVSLPPIHREVYEALKGNFSPRAEASRADIEALGRAALRLLMAATSPALLVEGSSPYEPLAYQVPALEAAPGESLHALLRDLPRYELSPKFQEAVRIVAANAAAGRKTIVWTTFVRNITTLAELLAPYSPAVVHGGTADRDEEIRRFREDPDCMVLLSNPATLGEGISLHQVCHDAVYVDRDFVAGRFLQSLDRIHRLGLAPGTETRVTVLVAEGTIDEVVQLRLEAKLEFMGSILDDPEVRQLADLVEEPVGSVGLDMADIRELLRHLEPPSLAR